MFRILKQCTTLSYMLLFSQTVLISYQKYYEKGDASSSSNSKKNNATLEKVDAIFLEFMYTESDMAILKIENRTFNATWIREPNRRLKAKRCYIIISKTSWKEWDIYYLIGAESNPETREETADFAMMLSFTALQNGFKVNVFRKFEKFDGIATIEDASNYLQPPNRFSGDGGKDVFLVRRDRGNTFVLKVGCGTNLIVESLRRTTNAINKKFGSLAPEYCKTAYQTVARYQQGYANRFINNFNWGKALGFAGMTMSSSTLVRTVSWMLQTSSTGSLASAIGGRSMNANWFNENYCIVIRVMEPTKLVYRACGENIDDHSRVVAKILGEELNANNGQTRVTPFVSIIQAHNAIKTEIGDTKELETNITDFLSGTYERPGPFFKIFRNEEGDILEVEKSKRPLQYYKFHSNFCYFLDSKSITGVFLWIGKEASTSVISAATRFLEKYYREFRTSALSPATIMQQGEESIEFRILFPNWVNEFPRFG